MPVHAIRVETAKTSAGVPVETLLNQFRAGVPETLPAQAQDPTLIEPTETEDLNEPYRRMLVRVEESEDPDALLDRLDDLLRGNPAWYRIRYHRCNHDLSAAERTGGCSWDAPREEGPVPADLA